jgi:hypothetical protein
VEKGGDAGIDGALVWVLALASGLMSSTDASTFREALMRILVSVVVALLWTRDLMAAKQVARKTGAEQRPAEKVRWRVRPDRIAVWLRLADAVDTTVVTVESARQVAKFLRVTDRERDGRQWPFTVKARAYRGRMRMISEALRHGDPTEVHRKLSAAAFAEAMNRLGVAPDAGPDQTGEPDRSVAKPTGPDDNGDRSDTGPVSPAGPVQQTGQHDRSEDEDRPVRPVQPRPVSPKPDRSARPVKPTGPTGSTPLEELEEVCRAWAKANNVDPARMSRAKVAKVVRDAGYSCSTDRAGNVQELLDPKGATSEMERRLTGPTGPGGAR